MTDGKRAYIDLHIHSTHSDGVHSPRTLVQLASSLGLSAIAIADHDAVSGIPDALEEGALLGVQVLSAVELSVSHKGYSDVHLLGYCIDCHDREFAGHLAAFQARREKRNEEILERVNRRLEKQGKEAIPLEQVLEYAGGTVGRPHIARALLERGYAGSVEEAFDAYLIPCNIPKLYWPIADALAEIRRIGGVSVLAHPTSITRDRDTLAEIIIQLISLGLDGIEVFNNMASADEMTFLEKLADRMGLLCTGGSDFHGIEDAVEMGKGRDGIRFDAALLTPLLLRAGR